MVGAIFFAVALLWFACLYVVASFSYEVDRDRLLIRWRVLGFIPFGRTSVPLSRVQEARRFELRRDWWPGARVLGNLFWHPAVLVILEAPVFNTWPTRRIYVTPPDPDAFIGRLRAAQHAHPADCGASEVDSV